MVRSFIRRAGALMSKTDFQAVRGDHGTTIAPAQLTLIKVINTEGVKSI